MANRPQSVTIYPQSIVVNISPMAFHSWSEQYLAAARAVQPRPGFSPVPYYLHGLAMELALKAFLLAKGVPRRTLASHRLGHDLSALLAKSELMGIQHYLPITAQHRSQVSLLTDYFSSRALEYFDLEKALKGFSGLPDLAIVGTFLDTLLETIKAECHSA
jgi:hypothetical protein